MVRTPAGRVKVKLPSNIDRKEAFRIAKKLGAAFKPNFPATYTVTQTRPIYRTTPAVQQVELERLYYTAIAMGKPMTWKMARGILNKKYARRGIKFDPHPVK